MTQTLPMELMEEMSQTKVNELSHHGILGMKWYVRRFQKYPRGYSGDGKYVGPDGAPRHPSRKEKKADKKFNKLKTIIDEGTKRAINDSDKKLLKVLKPAMTQDEYNQNYAQLVANGVTRAVKNGDVKGLKSFKKDMGKNEYKDAKNLLEFNEAVNRLDTKAMNKKMSKIKNEDLRVSAERILTITALQKTKIEALKTESEASAKIAKLAKTAGSVASLTQNTLNIVNNVIGVKNAIQKASSEEKNRIEKENQKQIEKAIKTGDPEKISKWKGQMTIKQIEDANKYVYLNNKDKIATQIKNKNYNVIADPAFSSYITGQNVDELTKFVNFMDRKGNKGNQQNNSNADSFNQYLDNKQQNKKKKK